MEDDEPIGFQIGHGASLALVIGELHQKRLVVSRPEILDHGSHLATGQTLLREIRQKRHGRQQWDSSHVQVVLFT
jgi:hypothetical protein